LVDYRDAPDIFFGMRLRCQKEEPNQFDLRIGRFSLPAVPFHNLPRLLRATPELGINCANEFFAQCTDFVWIGFSFELPRNIFPRFWSLDFEVVQHG